MANSDKDILITTNKGLAAEPIIKFNGADNTPVYLRVLDNGTVSFEGSAGQLFSVSNSLSGSIFAVNDVSGIPSIEVLDTGEVRLAQYTGNVGIGKTGASTKLDVNGTTTGIGFVSTASGYNMTTVTRPTAPTLALVNSAGNIDVGTHYYYVTYTTSIGETELSPVSSVITTDANNAQVTVTIPVSADSRVTGRKIYRSDTNGASWLNPKLVATISNNTAVTYVDNISDANRTGVGAYYRDNTTNSGIMIDGVNVMRLGSNTIFGLSSGTTIINGTSSAGANTVVGKASGTSFTSGSQNTILGSSSGTAITTGGDNIAIGFQANGATTSNGNIAIGRNTGQSIGAGYNNTYVGYYSGWGNNLTTGVTYNTLIGNSTGYNISNSASANVALGNSASYNLTSGSNNIHIGNYAGYYSTTQSKEFFINSLDRTDRAGDIAKSIIYGVQHATPSAANQTLTFNASTSTTYGATINTGADATVGLKIKATASQTANLLEWQNSGGSAMSSIDKNGVYNAPVGYKPDVASNIYLATNYL